MPARRMIWRWGALAAGVALLAVAPRWASSYTLHTAVVALYYVVLASSWNLLAGYTGQFSLAHHAFAAIGGYTSGLLVHYFGVPIYVGLVAAAVVVAGVGALLGLLVLRMRAIYLAIATWAFAETTRVVVVAWYPVTRGALGLHVPSLLGTLEPRPYYYVFLVFAAVSLTIMYALVTSPIGRFMRAIKDDELAASSLGVDTVRWKIFVFSVTSLFAGTAGALYAHYVGIMSPQTIEFYEIGKLIVMVIVGGLGRFAGPLVGAPLVHFLSEYLREYGGWRMVLFSLAVIVLMRTYREGALALAGEVYRRLRRGPGRFSAERTPL